MISISFQICSLAYIILLLFVYFLKRRLVSIENRIYAILLITSFAILLIDIFSVILMRIIVEDSIFFILKVLFAKGYLIFLLFWLFLFTTYVFSVSLSSEQENEKKAAQQKKIFTVFLALFLTASVIICFLPIAFYSIGDMEYTHGPSIIFTYIIAGMCVLTWLFRIIVSKIIFNSKKYYPVFWFLGLGVVVVIIQFYMPQLLLVSSVIALSTFLMFFTIENPDMQLIEELNIARERADRASLAKTDFLSNMSHEIRTPLNAIVGFSQALSEEDLPEAAKEEVNDIIMSSNNLLEIVNGILDISKIEANKLELVSVEYDANVLFKEVIILTNARLASKPLDFKIQIDPNLPPVLYGDRLRIKQVALNLLTNAIKYTKEGYFSLTVSSIVKEDICRLVIAVEDSGIGIKPEDIDKLFSKFQRFELERNITTEGTGLGLAITKSLVELMGGKIIVQSIYGEGSKFTLFIDQRVVPKTADELQEQISEDTSPFNARGQKILVVDDNKVNLKVARRLLRDYYVDVDLVLSGQECIEKILGGEKYDLILMDDMMPRMSGTDALRNLKNIIGFDTPIVALTANAITGMRERYLSLGFDEYLAKPIDCDLLNHVLRRFLRENEDDTYNIELENTQELNLNITDFMEIERNRDFLKQNGVDYQRGLELLGDIETYEMTLEDFFEEAESRLEKINKYRDNMDMANYAILVHSMKSDSKYLGFTKLAELSYNHELASKDSNIEYINDHYSELIDEVNRVLKIVEKYLGK